MSGHLFGPSQGSGGQPAPATGTFAGLTEVTIGKLTADTPSDSHFIRGEVSLLWPYSSLSRSFAFQLCDQDIYRAFDKGQIKASFASGIGRQAEGLVRAGATVRLSLAGSIVTRAPKTSAQESDWQIEWREQVVIQVDDKAPVVLVASDEPEETDATDGYVSAVSQASQLSRSTPVPQSPFRSQPAPSTPARTPSRMAPAEPGSWHTPPNLLRRRPRPSLDDTFSSGAFLDYDDDLAGPLKKRSRMSRDSSSWVYDDGNGLVPSSAPLSANDSLVDTPVATPSATPMASPPRHGIDQLLQSRPVSPIQVLPDKDTVIHTDSSPQIMGHPGQRELLANENALYDDLMERRLSHDGAAQTAPAIHDDDESVIAQAGSIQGDAGSDTETQTDVLMNEQSKLYRQIMQQKLGGTPGRDVIPQSAAATVGGLSSDNEDTRSRMNDITEPHVMVSYPSSIASFSRSAADESAADEHVQHHVTLETVPTIFEPSSYMEPQTHSLVTDAEDDDETSTLAPTPLVETQQTDVEADETDGVAQPGLGPAIESANEASDIENAVPDVYASLVDLAPDSDISDAEGPSRRLRRLLQRVQAHGGFMTETIVHAEETVFVDSEEMTTTEVELAIESVAAENDMVQRQLHDNITSELLDRALADAQEFAGGSDMDKISVAEVLQTFAGNGSAAAQSEDDEDDEDDDEENERSTASGSETIPEPEGDDDDHEDDDMDEDDDDDEEDAGEDGDGGAAVAASKEVIFIDVDDDSDGEPASEDTEEASASAEEEAGDADEEVEASESEDESESDDESESESDDVDLSQFASQSELDRLDNIDKVYVDKPGTAAATGEPEVIVRAGLTTGYSEYPALDEVSFNYTGDFIGVVASAGEVQAPTTDKGDHFMRLDVVDRSTKDGAPLRVQVSRPFREALPEVAVGDAILCRQFYTAYKRGRLLALSGTQSAWAVWERLAGESAGDDDVEATDRVQVRGPPVEYGPEETAYARELIAWFARENGLAQ
ncbi:uncharacterized protein V1510DRAFT_420532 [Dipodascopsis tothii]|uniref:uncharacterized protein n=1 Tax=Dipodascopsis tothii TaxID=44089 RepID=UPI0034CFB699